jgi:hypothetical protein
MTVERGRKIRDCTGGGRVAAKDGSFRQDATQGLGFS